MNPNTTGYKNSLEHLLDELHRVRLQIHHQVTQFQFKGHDPADHLKGLVIRDNEIDDLLDQPLFFDGQPSPEPEDLKNLQKQLEACTGRIESRKAAALKGGTTLRLERLKDLFSLTAFDMNTLLVCLAPELDLRFEKIYAYLQDDVTKKRPAVDLVLKILCPSLRDQVAARRRFISSAPLFQNGLLQLYDDPSQQRPSLLGKYLKLDERVINYLFDSDDIPDELSQYVQCLTPTAELNSLLLPKDAKTRLAKIIGKSHSDDSTGSSKHGRRLILYLQGPYGVGKQTTAEAICRELGAALLVIDQKLVNGHDAVAYKKLIRMALRESRLQGAIPYVDKFDPLLADDRHPLLTALLQEINSHCGLIFLAGEKKWEPADSLRDTPFIRLSLPRPGYSDRYQLWERFLKDGIPVDSDIDLGALANKFNFSAGQIVDAVQTAKNLALWQSADNPRISMEDLSCGCRIHSNQKLGSLSQKIEPKYTWNDIVLPADQMAQLKEITNTFTYKHVVYDTWGFDRKLSLGKGLNALFYGPSGTGKTMAAEIIAHELKLDIYKIDLSTVVSKYIGETEKNLSNIFKEAETGNAILFFDEADALFGKRSEVKDSHDRYANIEIGYLLQKMDEYSGVVILATNLKKNMDDAFLRRMHFSVEFPFPDEKYRLKIWQKIFPFETPLSHTIEFDFLAEQFKFSGGNIKNIALAAAFYAAVNGQTVAMEHLILATRRELQKNGKLGTKNDFGKYYQILQ